MFQTFSQHRQIGNAPSGTVTCDVAVIGSGPGGAITACLLAEAGRDVLLLEEGAALPIDSPSPYTPAEMTAKYRSGGLTLALGRPHIAYVEGRTLGGGSEVNSGLYHRTPPEVLAAWRSDWHVDALTDAELEPHFAACEEAVQVGPSPGPPPPAAAKLREGATALGWASQDVPRWYSFPPEVPKGARQSMSATFLPRAQAAGCRTLTGVRAQRLRHTAGRWEIQAASVEGVPIKIRARDVFVAGGAIQTPALLRRSGIKRGVGDTLSLHPTVKVTAVFPDEVNGPHAGVPSEQVKEFAPQLSFGCSIAAPPYLAVALADHSPAAARRVQAEWRHMAVYYAMTPGLPVGTVRTLPGVRDPLVRYRIGNAELSTLAEGLGKLCRLLLAAGATSLYPSIARSETVHDPGQLDSLPQRLPRDRSRLMTVHLFASVSMGEDPRRCATDSFGAVHGTEGLHVADGSLLCSAPGVNPQGTIMALAHRNAMHYLER